MVSIVIAGIDISPDPKDRSLVTLVISVRIQAKLLWFEGYMGLCMYENLGVIGRREKDKISKYHYLLVFSCLFYKILET